MGRPPHDVRRSDDSTKGGDNRRSDDSAKGAVISVNILQISGGVGGGGSPPHDDHDARRGDDSAKGALITVNLLQISGVGEEGQVQISQQAQHFSKVRYRFGGPQAQHFRNRYQFRGGAALSQGTVQSLTQAQH